MYEHYKGSLPLKKKCVSGPELLIYNRFFTRVCVSLPPPHPPYTLTHTLSLHHLAAIR